MRKPANYWSHDNVIAELRALQGQYGYARSKHGHISLNAMVQRRFGTWAEACRVAGVVDYADTVVRHQRCTIEGCSGVPRSPLSPWCEMHYGRNRRNGDPEKLHLCQYAVNERAFDDWTDSNAWLLGMLWTDGWMVKGNSVGIKSKDAEVLEHAKRILGTTADIKTVWTRGKPYQQIQVASKGLADKLRSLGMHRAKSLSIEYPSALPEEYFWSFMRGVIDGDGCVSMFQRPNAPHRDCMVQVVSGSQVFAAQLFYKLIEHGVSPRLGVRERYLKCGRLNPSWMGADLYQITLRRISDIAHMHDAMYLNADVPCIKRKRALLDEFYTAKRRSPGNPLLVKRPMRSVSQVVGVHGDSPFESLCV